jgi:acetyl-CoA carboxylase alpha subunit
MPAAKFDTTIHAIQNDPKKLSADKAVKDIDSWEQYLSKHEHQGVKTIVSDLDKLKKLLQAGEPDEKAIKNLLHKLGKETTAVGGDESIANASKIKELGNALSHVS